MTKEQRAIADALEHLRIARTLLRTRAKAPRAADYVARAIKSTEGAARHAERVGGRNDP